VDFIPQFRLPYPGSPEGVLDVMLEVDEGRRFSIESIGFLGLAKAEEQTIRDLLPIKAGSRYSRKTLLETLRILNRLGLFEEVRENDIITRTNIGGPTVNLDFQLKEKNK
jgi:outer membrane protein assembly factor BamA